MKLTFEEGISKLKMSLKDYMISQGTEIHTNNSFRCPNKAEHKHGDKNPSGYLFNNDNPRWQCLKCSTSGDTFDFASFVNGLPTEGPGFKYETIPHVIEALKLDIDIDYGIEEKPSYVTLSSEVKAIFKSNPMDPKLLTDGTFGPNRKYSLETAKKIVEMFNVAQLKEPIYDHPVFRPTTFPGSKPLLVPITKNGFYLGCVGRHPEDKVAEGAPKYHNSLKTETANYPSIINYDRALRATKKNKRLYIFEGVFNSILAVVSGMENSIGMLGVNSNFSDLEDLIAHSSVREIVFCLDKDLAGADKAIQIAKTFHGMGYLCLFYKAENNGLDYDEEFSQKGEELVKEITTESNLLSLIEYILYSKASYLAKQDISKVTKFEMLMEDISAYGSIISANNYATAIEKYYKEINEQVSFDDILPRIRQCLLDKKSPLLSRINDIVSTNTKLISEAKTVEDKISLSNKLGEIVTQASQNVSVGLKVSGKRDLERMIKDQEIHGARIYKTGYANIDSNNDPANTLNFMQESLCGLIGKPSHGKSLFVRGFALHQALNNPEAMIIYFSTDDSARRTLSWMIAGMAKVPLGEVIKPYKERDQSAKDHIQEAQDKLRKIYGESLLLYDKEQAGSTIDQIRIVNDTVREYPNKRILTFTDNLFNSNDISMIAGNEGSKRYAIDSAIEQWKQCTMSKIDIAFNTLEVKKNINGRLTDSDIKETGSINFRNDYTFATFNSFKEWRGDSKMVTMLYGQQVPIIEFTVLKNKSGAAGQTYFFHLDGPCGILEPVTEPEIIDHYRSLMNTDYGNNRQSGGGGGGKKEANSMSAYRENSGIF
jgi:replicative DNA helicase